jgi:hypothetical protein
VNEDKAKDTLMGVLSYINSPFKLFVVVLLSVLGFIGYFVYTHQGIMVGAYLKSRELPKLDESRFDLAASMLFRETKAETVSIFAVDPILNRRVLVRAYAKDGIRHKILEGANVGLFSGNQANNADVVRLMAGEIPCGQYLRPQSEAGLWYIHQGVRFTCRASIPPDVSSFIGQITIGWAAEPDLEYARSILEVVARGLVLQK